MTSPLLVGSANVMSELYFETLKSLDLLEPLERVPFALQSRRTGLTSAARCLAILASQAHGCLRLTDCHDVLGGDTRLGHWLGGRKAPHDSTLSRTLQATGVDTTRGLRKVLAPLSDQAFVYARHEGRFLMVDVDSKGLPAAGKTYQQTTYGRMNDGRLAKGYRLHLMSLDNRWPLDMEFTGAGAHGVGSAMVLVKRLAHRVSGGVRRRTVIRGDSAYGCVRFVRWTQRYHFGYLLKGYNASTARRLRTGARGRPIRVPRSGRPDLLATECGRTVLTGYTRQKGRDGIERRHACRVKVPRVVVYEEDPAQVAEGATPEVFCLITTLPRMPHAAGKLLAQYNQRGGHVENVFSQLDQAFRITHLRSRRFYGNYTFLLLALIAANLTQQVRARACGEDQPIPDGLAETVRAAAHCGLRLEQDPTAGCVLFEPQTPTPYTNTFLQALTCCCQHRLRFAA